MLLIAVSAGMFVFGMFIGFYSGNQYRLDLERELRLAELYSASKNKVKKNAD